MPVKDNRLMESSHFFMQVCLQYSAKVYFDEFDKWLVIHQSFSLLRNNEV